MPAKAPPASFDKMSSVVAWVDVGVSDDEKSAAAVLELFTVVVAPDVSAESEPAGGDAAVVVVQSVASFFVKSSIGRNTGTGSVTGRVTFDFAACDVRWKIGESSSSRGVNRDFDGGLTVVVNFIVGLADGLRVVLAVDDAAVDVVARLSSFTTFFATRSAAVCSDGSNLTT